MTTAFLRPSESHTVLSEAPFFADLSDRQRSAVLELGAIEDREAGEHFYRIGEPAKNFYVLARGIVRLTIGLDQRNATAGDILHRGEVFGWAALTPNANRRIATAVCLTPASVLALDGKGLLALMDQDHTLGYYLTRQLILVVTGTFTACAAG